jgi:hypothetical protein
MNSGLDRIELGEIARPGTARPGIATPGVTEPASSRFRGWSGNGRTGYFSLAWLPAVLIAGLGVWMLASGHLSKPSESEPVLVTASVATEPLPVAADTAPARDPSFNLVTSEAIVPGQPAPVDRLKISSQSWRRGGLGSNALVTFTLRNSNDYAVGDIEISCAFARRDGSLRPTAPG